MRNRPQGQEIVLANDALAGFESANGGNIGIGGSYARFQINNNALYTIYSSSSSLPATFDRT